MEDLDVLARTLRVTRAVAAAPPGQRAAALASSLQRVLGADLVALSGRADDAPRGPRGDALAGLHGVAGRLLAWEPPGASPGLLRSPASRSSVAVAEAGATRLVASRGGGWTAPEEELLRRCLRLAVERYELDRAERLTAPHLGVAILSPGGVLRAATPRAEAWLEGVDLPGLLQAGSGLRRLPRPQAGDLQASLSRLAGAGDEAWSLVLWPLEPDAEEDILERARRRVAGLGLTPRETEVAALAAAGRSNSEIARAQGLSPNTIKTQLLSVYRKTGLNSRDRLAAFVLDRGGR